MLLASPPPPPTPHLNPTVSSVRQLLDASVSVADQVLGYPYFLGQAIFRGHCFRSSTGFTCPCFFGQVRLYVPVSSAKRGYMSLVLRPSEVICPCFFGQARLYVPVSSAKRGLMSLFLQPSEDICPCSSAK